MTRMRAVPVTPPTAALTSPACAPAAASEVNVPFATVPLRFSTDHVGLPGEPTVLPFASKARTLRVTGSPGLRINSVGVTNTDVAAVPAGATVTALFVGG